MQLCDPGVERHADARDEVLGGLAGALVLENLAHFPDGGPESVHPGHDVVHGTVDPDSTIDRVVWEVGLLLEHGNPGRNRVDLCLGLLFVEAVPCGVGCLARGVVLDAQHLVSVRFEKGATRPAASSPPP